MMRDCLVAECGLPMLARGYCRKHYKRVMKTGGVELGRRENGAGAFSTHGYIRHGRAKKGQHVLIAEQALGRALPRGAEVHHVNEDKADNRPGNLVICPSRAYHALLHQRQRAIDACGNAHWRKCPYCKAYGDPERMMKSRAKNNSYFYHRECAQEYKRAHRRSA